jgi:prevent-host-death family protein
MQRQTVGARELKTRLGTYLRRVRLGQTLVVTDRGEPIAELRPLSADAGLPDALVRLSATGAVTLPTERALAAFRRLRTRGASLSRAIVAQREDRL